MAAMEQAATSMVAILRCGMELACTTQNLIQCLPNHETVQVLCLELVATVSQA